MIGTIGEIRVFAGTFAPQNWALCNGQTLPVNDYQALYALIGNTYGGDSTNMCLPNLCGRAAIKAGSGPGLTPYQLGANGGLEEVMIGEANLPAHSHSFSVSSAAATVNTPAGNNMAAMVDTANPNNTVKSFLQGGISGEKPVELHPGIVSKAYGAGEVHENRMPFMALNYIICAVGLYPSFQ